MWTEIRYYYIIIGEICFDRNVEFAMKYEFGRKPKHDDFEDLQRLGGEYQDDYDSDADDEDENEEVDFDTPSFKRDQIWNDYAEDLDYDD